MEQNVEKFLQAEETASKLVQTLKSLEEEGNSYKGASQELDVARQRLVGLIQNTGEVAKGTHEVLKTVREVGGPEIMDSLAKLRTLVIVTLVVSIAAVVVGITSLVR